MEGNNEQDVHMAEHRVELYGIKIDNDKEHSSEVQQHLNITFSDFYPNLPSDPGSIQAELIISSNPELKPSKFSFKTKNHPKITRLEANRKLLDIGQQSFGQKYSLERFLLAIRSQLGTPSSTNDELRQQPTKQFKMIKQVRRNKRREFNICQKPDKHRSEQSLEEVIMEHFHIEKNSVLIEAEKDSRTRVENPRAYPYSAIGMVEALFTDSRSMYGTGVLIDADLVLTCAHLVIFNHQKAYEVRFRPGLRGTAGRQFLADPYVHPNFECYNFQTDLAVLKLRNIESQGDMATNYGSVPILADYTDNESIEVEVAGYPGNQFNRNLEEKQFYQYYAKGNLSEINTNFLYHHVSTSEGQSGSPVLCQQGGQTRIIGIHILADIANHRRVAVRMTKSVIELINSMISISKIQEKELLNWSCGPGKQAIELLSKYVFPKLKKLVLDYCHIGDSGIKILFGNQSRKKFNRLTLLNLSHNDIGDHGYYSLISGAHPYLQSLNLCSNNITDLSIQYLAYERTFEQLRQLNISDNRLGMCYQGTQVKQLKARVEKSFPKLRQLYLSKGVILVDIGKDVMGHVGEGMFLGKDQHQ